MVCAWYMSNTVGKDQREQLHLDPPQYIKVEDLKKVGVLYWKIDADHYESEGVLEKIRKERNYNYTDVIEVNEKLPEYEKKLETFFIEHLHTDEEIRLILEGSGYFDVRDTQDKWIRIEMSKGDLIVLPAGIYHRFTLDTKNYVKAMRLFVGEPVWTPHNRPGADQMTARQQYLLTQKN